MIFTAQLSTFEQHLHCSSNIINIFDFHACVHHLVTTLNPPPSSPSLLSWASYHQSQGVLCAQPEWLGWALPFIAVLGAAACVLLQHCHQMHALSPAEQACTPYHLLSSPRRFLDTQPTILEATLITFHSNHH